MNTGVKSSDTGKSVSSEFVVGSTAIKGDIPVQEKPVCSFGTRDLGLAAYARVKGLKLVTFDGKFFMFESAVHTKNSLEIEYANSCCREHDSSVMFLRQMLNVSQNHTQKSRE